MPAFETMDRNQTVTLWAAAGPQGGSYGTLKVHPPREIDVRWVWTRREAVDPQGNPVSLEAEVVVAEKVGIDSIFFPGGMSTFYGTGSGSGYDAVELYVVKLYEETEDLKGRHVRRTLGLARHGSSLPTLVS